MAPAATVSITAATATRLLITSSPIRAFPPSDSTRRRAAARRGSYPTRAVVLLWRTSGAQRMRFLRLLAAIALFLCAAAAIDAEEGMWTFDNFPIARANQALGTRIDQAWLDRVRLSSVRFGSCSAGIVSPDGLVLTNNHCVATCVANLSTTARDYAGTGFTPERREDEARCPGALAEVLHAITDVTRRMQAAGGTLTGQAFTAARNAETSRIESETCAGDSTRRCLVIPLYRGGQFKVYRSEERRVGKECRSRWWREL